MQSIETPIPLFEKDVLINDRILKHLTIEQVSSLISLPYRNEHYRLLSIIIFRINLQQGVQKCKYIPIRVYTMKNEHEFTHHSSAVRTSDLTDKKPP